MPGRGLNQNNSDIMWRFCDITGRNRPVLSLHHTRKRRALSFFAQRSVPAAAARYDGQGRMQAASGR